MNTTATREQYQEVIIAAAEAAIELRDIDKDLVAAAMALSLARAWRHDMKRAFGD